MALLLPSDTLLDPSTSNAAEVMKVLLRLERETLAPYELPGNRISMNMYDELPLPWTVFPPIMAFPESQYVKHDYDREGILSNGESFFNGSEVSTLDEIEKSLGTASMVTRWRAANSAGTKQDVTKAFVKELRDTLGGQERLERGSGTAILLFKKCL